MATEVFLIAEVKGLGSEGNVVTVSDGYARNYLFPKKLAATVTEATRRRLAKMQQKREETFKMDIEAARAKAVRLEQTSCTIAVKAGEEGKMFGSVTTSHIADELQRQGIDVDKQQILLDAPVKELGVYTVGIRLHQEVTAAIKVWVVEE